MVTLPFTLDELMGGLASGQGLLSLEDDFLRVQATVTVLGLLRSRACDVRVPLSRVDDVTFRKGWFRGEMVIRARDLGAVASIPGASSGRLTLTIAKRDWPAAAEWATDVRLRLAELRLLERHTARGAGLPARGAGRARAETVMPLA